MTATRDEALPLVLVAVGTDHHRFDRLIEWVEDWLDGREYSVRCLVQHCTSRAPRNAEAHAYLQYDELQAAMSEAAVVVSHGGPGTLTEARSHGHLPICVPRDPANGEHVDGHQLRFARHLAKAGMVTLAETRADFEAALTAALAEASRRPLVPEQRDSRTITRPPAVDRIAELLSTLLHTAAPSQRHRS